MAIKTHAFLLATGLALLMAGSLAAQELLTGADTEAVLASARGIGEATLSTQPNGDPLINGQVEGTSYQIYFRNCTGNEDCEDLNFYAGFSSKPTLEVINTWNRDKRFSRAYIDEVGDAAVEMDLDMVAGVTPDYLESQIGLWPQIIAGFEAHIGYK